MNNCYQVQLIVRIDDEIKSTLAFSFFPRFVLAIFFIRASTLPPAPFFWLRLWPVAAPASKFNPNWGGGKNKFSLSSGYASGQWRRQHPNWGGKKVNNAREARKTLPFLCWNCQIWADFNTFEIIWGGKKILGGGANAPMPPVAPPLPLAKWKAYFQKKS